MQYLQFNKIIVQLIQDGSLIYAAGVLVDGNQMGSYWLITNKIRSIKIENRLFYIWWQLNTLRVAETITVLDVITMIVKKSKNITRSTITVLNDNLKLVNMINSTLSPTQFTLKAAAEVAEIKELI